MRKIYLNEDYQCSVIEKADSVQSVETDFFDGKCNAFVEGYRFVPEGQQWAAKDGTVLHGGVIAPFKDYTYLEMVQNVYEQLTEDITNMQLAVAGLYESGVQ